MSDSDSDYVLQNELNEPDNDGSDVDMGSTRTVSSSRKRAPAKDASTRQSKVMKMLRTLREEDTHDADTTGIAATGSRAKSSRAVKAGTAAAKPLDNNTPAISKKPKKNRDNVPRILKMLAQGLKQRDDAVLEHTPAALSLPHVLDLGHHDRRDFELVPGSVEIATPENKGYDKNSPFGDDDVNALYWKFVLRDKTRPKITIQPYVATRRASKKAPDNHRGALLARFGHTREQITQLAKIVVEYLNKTPVDLPHAGWNDHGLPPAQANVVTFVELNALYTWEPHGAFDWTRLPPLWVGSIGSKTAQTREAKKGLGGKNIYGIIGCFPKYQANKRTSQSWFARISQLTLVADRVESKPVVCNVTTTFLSPDAVHEDAQQYPGKWFARWSEPPSTAHDTSTLGMTYLQSTMEFLAGKVGTTKEIAAVLEFRKAATAADQKVFTKSTSGSFNGRQILAPWQNTHDIRLSPAALEQLECADFTEVQIRNACAIRLASFNTIHAAYVYQSATVAFVAEKSVLKAVSAVAQTSDEVNHGTVTLATIKTLACQCAEEDKEKTEHVCMHCVKPFRCSIMQRDGDDRLLCPSCRRLPAPLHDMHPIKMSTILAYGARNSVFADMLIHGKGSTLAYTAEGLSDHLKAQKLADFVWQDAYGPQRDSREQTFPDATRLLNPTTSKRVTHPLQPSLDKIDAIAIDRDGQIGFHLPSNVRLTTLAVNICKTDTPIHILAWLQRLVTMSGVLPELRDASPELSPEEIRSTYAAFNCAADNLFLIRKIVPWHKASQLAFARKYPVAVRELNAQASTGCWQGTLRNMTVRSIFVSSQSFVTFQMSSYKHMPQSVVHYLSQFEMWTDHYIKILLVIIQDIENDPFSNPEGLRLPRNPTDQSPWLWRVDIQLIGDGGWRWLYETFFQRLRSMLNWCDKRNAGASRESPATLLIEFVVQWFRSGGGKCHVFGFVMVPYAGHPQSFSIGRARHAYDISGNVTGLVQPGDLMQTGCTLLMPTSYQNHYRRDYPTIVFESRLANMLRYNFPPDDAIFRDTILAAASVRESSDQYEGPKTARVYGKVPFPRTFTGPEWYGPAREFFEDRGWDCDVIGDDIGGEGYEDDLDDLDEEDDILMDGALAHDSDSDSDMYEDSDMDDDTAQQLLAAAAAADRTKSATSADPMKADKTQQTSTPGQTGSGSVKATKKTQKSKGKKNAASSSAPTAKKSSSSKQTSGPPVAPPVTTITPAAAANPVLALSSRSNAPAAVIASQVMHDFDYLDFYAASDFSVISTPDNMRLDDELIIFNNREAAGFWMETTGPMLKLLKRRRAEGAVLTDRGKKVENTLSLSAFGQPSLRSTLAFCKTATTQKPGLYEQAWIEDDAATFLIRHACAGKTPPDTFLFDAVRSGIWYDTWEQQPEPSRWSPLLGDPFVVAMPTAGSIRRCVFMLSSNGHWISFTVLYQEDKKEIHVRYWNSAEYRPDVGSWKNVTKFVTAAREYLSPMPPIDLPQAVTWPVVIDDMQQYRQVGNVDCGLFAIEAAITDMTHGLFVPDDTLDTVQYSKQLREKHLGIIYAALMGEPISRWRDPDPITAALEAEHQAFLANGVIGTATHTPLLAEKLRKLPDRDLVT